MARISYLVFQYPQLSESYASTEMRAVESEYELDVVSLRWPDVRGEASRPFQVLSDESKIIDRMRAFAPDVIHTHWLGDQLGLACRVARKLDVPLSIRAHSFDVLWPSRRKGPLARLFARRDTSAPIAENLDFLRSEGCLGILTFPFSIERLTRAGIPEHKLIPCGPVCDIAKFHDASPNGSGVLNGGACLPKKDFHSYLELASRVPEQHFDLYPIGYQAEELRAANERLGGVVAIHSPVPHAAMPGVYKRHEWYVYTADRKVGTVGWPVSVPEAQAAGVGVCMPRLRPDIAELVGPGGFVYDSLDEVVEIIRQPFPPSMRKASFEHARQFDVRNHIARLTDLWKAAC